MYVVIWGNEIASRLKGFTRPDKAAGEQD